MKIYIQYYSHHNELVSFDIEDYASAWDEDRMETEGQIERLYEGYALQNRKLGRLLALLATKSVINASEIVQIVEDKIPYQAHIKSED